MARCALLGGTPVREKAIPWTSTMGEEESKLENLKRTFVINLALGTLFLLILLPLDFRWR